MADFGIKPDIPLGFKPAPAMSLGDLLGTATKAMEFQRMSELYPELIKKTQQEVRSAELGIAEKEMQGMASRLTAAINNPMIIAAEEDPNSVDQTKLLSYITTAGREHAKAMKIDPQRADQLLAPILRIAEENPGMVRSALKEELLRGLDAATRTSTLSSGSPMGVSTIPRNQPAFRGAGKAGVTAADMTAPISGPIRGQDLTIAPVEGSAAQIIPIQGGQVAPSAQVPPVQVAQGQADKIVQPETGNYPLMFEPPTRAGIQRPKREGEDKAIEFGQNFRTKLNGRALELTRSDENLDHVIRSATKLQESLGPTTGPLGIVKRKYAEIVGNPQYQQLKKDLAQAQQANLNALNVGGNSVAGLELNRDAMGDVTYAPEVLVEIARRTKADNTNLRLMHQALDNHSRKFGDANTDRFIQMWTHNADSKIFQIMNINKDITDPKLKADAAAKVLQGMNEAQREALNKKYQRILQLTTTGDITK